MCTGGAYRPAFPARPAFSDAPVSRSAYRAEAVLALMTEPQAELKRFLAQRSNGSFGHFGDFYDRRSRFRVGAQFSDIRFSVLPTHDLLSCRLCHVKLLSEGPF
jgi:hypothetical protein